MTYNLEFKPQALVYGSEYIFILYQRLRYTYKSVLREKLKPILLTCKVPFNQLNYDFQGNLYKIFLVTKIKSVCNFLEIQEPQLSYIISIADKK